MDVTIDAAAAPFLLLAVLFTILLAAPALPQEFHRRPSIGTCGPHHMLAELLVGTYGLIPVGAGLLENGLLVEVWADDDGQWVTIGTRPGRLSCITGRGVDWQTFRRERPT